MVVSLDCGAFLDGLILRLVEMRKPRFYGSMQILHCFGACGWRGRFVYLREFLCPQVWFGRVTFLDSLVFCWRLLQGSCYLKYVEIGKLCYIFIFVFLFFWFLLYVVYNLEDFLLSSSTTAVHLLFLHNEISCSTIFFFQRKQLF